MRDIEVEMFSFVRSYDLLLAPIFFYTIMATNENKQTNKSILLYHRNDCVINEGELVNIHTPDESDFPIELDSSEVELCKCFDLIPSDYHNMK